MTYPCVPDPRVGGGAVRFVSVGVPVEMKTVLEYLRHAEQCEALAHGKMTPEEQAMIRKMAETWRMLAEQRKKNLAIREKARTNAA